MTETLRVEAIFVLLQLPYSGAKLTSKPSFPHQTAIRTYSRDIFEGVIGSNKKRKRKLLNGSELWKMKEGVFCFLLKAGV